jgi:hypothetical protein
MSGLSQFEEVVDLDAVSNIRDPLMERVEEIIEAARGGTRGERA